MGRLCSHCQEYKDDAEFYDARYKLDGKEAICKACKQFRYAPVRGVLAESTYLVLAELASRGIPACARTTTRTYWNWNKPDYTDIVAFGIVTVEAKISRAEYPVWIWTNKERSKQDDVVVLGNVRDDLEDWYILEGTSPVFYHQTDGYGKGRGRKTPEHLVGRRKRGVAISDRWRDHFAEAKGNWELLWDTFDRKSNLMRTGAFGRVQEVPVRE